MLALESSLLYDIAAAVTDSLMSVCAIAVLLVDDGVILDIMVFLYHSSRGH